MNAHTVVEPETLALWNEVSKTDPRHTKKVNQRGGFTAISAHYQVMSATKAFGPVGIGWGYSNGEPIWHETLVFVPVTLWHGERSNTFGPVYGGAEWKSNKGHLDSDAPKKAATDGLTKALSHLGFNADVFMGLFDDNKYVERVQREFEEEERTETEKVKIPGISKIKERLNALMLAGNASDNLEGFNTLVRNCADDLQKIKDGNHDYWTGDGGDEHEGFKKWIMRRRAELTPPEDSDQLRILLGEIEQCDTNNALQAIINLRGDEIDALDDLERDRFEKAFERRESIVRQVSVVSA